MSEQDPWEGQVPPMEEREPLRRSWKAQDLEDVLNGTYQPPRPTVGRRDDGVGLFYPGRTNSVVCESEGGKTWLAAIAALQEMNASHHVLYIDFEDDKGGMVTRLLVLGGNPDVIREFFHYVRPESRPTAHDLLDLGQILELKPTLAVIDGVTEAMTMYGQEITDNNGAAKFNQELLRPIKASGAAVVTLDHVVKNSENRGRYAIGAVHKLNGLDGVMYSMEAIHPFGIGLVGRTRVRIAKDRPAQIRKHAVHQDKQPMRWFMDLVIKSIDETYAEPHLYAPVQRPEDLSEEARKEADLKKRIEALKPKILQAMKKAKEPLSGREVEDRMSGTAANIRRALAELVDDGQVVREAGARGAMKHRLPGEAAEAAA